MKAIRLPCAEVVLSVLMGSAYADLLHGIAVGHLFYFLVDVVPLVYGKDKDRGIRLSGLELEAVTLGNGVSEEDLLVHDEHNSSPAYAFLLARMDDRPDLPTPIGVLRAIEAPRYENEVADQVRRVTDKKGAGDLEALLHSGDTWEVR